MAINKLPKNSRYIAIFGALCLVLVVGLISLRVISGTTLPSASGPGANGSSIPAGEYGYGGSRPPTSNQTQAEIPIEVLAEQERLANEALSMTPTTEASPGTDSNIPKFDCIARIFSDKSGGQQVVILQIDAPKSVKSIWADIRIGSESYQLEVKINNGFSRSVVGEIRTGENPPKGVKIYSAPVFIEEMILCED